MEKEAVKLVLWPRNPVEVDGSTVYRYCVVGMICTSRPITWLDESVVLEEYNDTRITDIFEDFKKIKPDFPLGSAESALMQVVNMRTNNE